MLTTYLNRTRRLLQNPSASTALYSDVDLTAHINEARGQIAGESESIRVLATQSLSVGQRPYNFSSFNVGTPASTGVQGVINVRQVLYSIGSGMKIVSPQNWPWFLQYHLNNPVPPSGAPTTWSQFGQGSAGIGTIVTGGGGAVSTGNLYIDPLPDFPYILSLDCSCYPQALASDSDVEALPWMWCDAVPFLSTYFALLSSQTSARQADANRMFEAYKTFAERARTFANPSVLRNQYEQSQDPTQMAKLGLKPAAPQGGA